jgi:dephospho-CoA kinase
MIIIGITWTIWWWKGTISDYLIKNKWFNHYSVSDYIVEEIKKKWLEINRDNMYQIWRDLKKKNWADFIVKELYKRAKIECKNAIIESIRSPGEVTGLQEVEDFKLLSIDANIKTRYERILLRKSTKDNINFETFVTNNKREWDSDSTDPTKINLSKCVKLANYKFDNNWSFKDLYKQIDKALNNFSI